MQKEKTYLERISEFHQIYKKEIYPIFKKYEKERKRKLIVEISAIILSLISALIVFGGNFIQDFIPYTLEVHFFSINIIFIIVGFISILVAISIPRLFVEEIKSKCLPLVLKVFPNTDWYSNIENISNSELNRSALFAPFNRRQSDDSFSGSYKGVNFEICETAMQYESSNGKNRRVESIFKGIVITFTANKTIKNRTIIATRGDKTAKNCGWSAFGIVIFTALQMIETLSENPALYFIYIGITFLIATALFFIIRNSKQDGEALDEVILEDPNFCKKFVAYSSDQVEARYLITTSFMNRFQNLKTAFGAQKAKCSFYDDKIMFAISTNKNLFEIGDLWHSLKNPKFINEMYNELYSVYKMIDYFKLNEKTGL